MFDLSGRVTRRGFVQVGYSGLLGMSLPGLLAGRATAANPTGRAKSVIVILLSGGLGQHDSFDMKPEAPEGIRGEFKPIETATPGVRISEHFPLLARQTVGTGVSAAALTGLTDELLRLLVSVFVPGSGMARRHHPIAFVFKGRLGRKQSQRPVFHEQ